MTSIDLPLRVWWFNSIWKSSYCRKHLQPWAVGVRNTPDTKIGYWKSETLQMLTNGIKWMIYCWFGWKGLNKWSVSNQFKFNDVLIKAKLGQTRNLVDMISNTKLYNTTSCIDPYRQYLHSTTDFFYSLVLFLWGCFRQDTQIVTDRYSGIRPSAVPDSQYSTDGEKGFFSTSIHEYLIPPIVLYVSSTKGPQNIYFIRPRENFFLGWSSPFPPY